ncbi:MAG: glycosyltransferase family 2 protein [Eubacteriales bacterium]|nr:glycosyltransferase family 2 protein [Eubacteriales bacterium]
MITVLMAVYQGKRYLEQQLDSILAQTVPVQLWISDDGSDDGSRELLEQYRQWYPKQIFLHHRAKELRDSFPGAAGNFAWLLSLAAKDGRAEYVMLSDQDDVWFNNKVKLMVRRMRQLEKGLGSQCPVLLHSDMEVVDEQLNRIHESFFQYAKCNPERTSFAELLVENPVTGGAVMMNRALLSLADNLPRACFMHDWWLAMTASCFGVIDYINEPLYQYRQHDGNVLGAKRTGSAEDIRERLFKGRQVEENYRRMIRQARAFGRQFGERMDGRQRMILNAFLALPYQSAAGRLQNIVRNRFFKSSRLQTAAMCVTMPHAGEKHRRSGRKAGGEKKQG